MVQIGSFHDRIMACSQCCHSGGTRIRFVDVYSLFLVVLNPTEQLLNAVCPRTNIFNQGMHEGTAGQTLDPFEREMRRRLWCILWVWDWWELLTPFLYVE